MGRHHNRLGQALLRVFAACLIAILAVCASAPLAAHTGHSHGGPAEDAEPPLLAPVEKGGIAPRVTAQSEQFELVGIANGRTLFIYLDSYAQNAPVIGASVEIEANDETLRGTESAEGIYTVSADWLDRPGAYEMVFMINAGDLSDLLVGTLEIASEDTAASAALQGPAAFIDWVSGGLGLSFSGLAVVVLALALAMVLLNWRKQRKATPGVTPRLWTMAADRWQQLGENEMSRVAVGALTGGASRVVKFSREAPALTVAIAGGFLLLLLLLSGRVLAADAEGQGQGSARGFIAVVAGPANSPRRLRDGTVFMPKPSQRLLSVRTTITEVEEVSRAIRIVGEVVADPGTSGQVQTLIRGRLLPVDDVWPRVGQRVKKDEVLAWVVPVVNPIDRGIIFQHLAQLDNEIVAAQQDHDRVLTRDSNASKEEVDAARGYYENLNRRRAAIALILRDRDKLRAPIVAPTDGIISASFAVAGQIAEEREKLFEVVDPNRIWVKANAYDIMAIGQIVDATARTSTGRSYRLKFLSRGPKLHRQTIPLYFKVENPDGVLSVGSLVSVMINTVGKRSGIVLPRAAVVRNTRGQQVVWRHAAPERFVPLSVRTQVVDSQHVMVMVGLEPGSRVVVESADLLNEVR